MKYFTKEWYNDTILAQMCFQIKQTERASRFSEKLFSSTYEAQKKWFIKNEKLVAKHNKQPFDAEKAAIKFNINYEENLEFVRSNIPEDILSKVADIRVLALGCADYNTLQAITRYCGQVNRRCEKICEKYDEEIELLAEKIDWYKINLMNLLSNAPIISAKKEEDRFIIETSKEYTDYACRLTLASPEIRVCDEIVGATVLHFEILPSESEYVEISLLCKTPEENFVEFSAVSKDFEIEEII
jgi:predicted  nucleic acid-binding Zn-ribbon protein